MTSVLYDAPGPRTRRRILIGSVIGSALLLALLAIGLKRLYDQGLFEPERWDVFSQPIVWEALLRRGLLATLKVAAIAGVMAVVLGAGLTALRLSQSAWLSVPARLFIELFRGLPVLLLMYFPIVMFTSLTPYMGAVIGLTLYNGSIIAEILRSGVVALPGGQREAGLAIGLTPTTTLRIIQLPQAVRIMLPTLISQLVVLLKDSSLAYIIAYPELLRQIRLLSNYYGNDYLFSFFFVGAGIYILVNMFFSQGANYLARRGSTKAAGASAIRPEIGAEGL